ncbi:MAG: potassium channel protein [Cyanobacteria bacterium J055]|nr:MAG: potassium channel protein [Cyanobacteria bacterium J055]
MQQLFQRFFPRVIFFILTIVMSGIGYIAFGWEPLDAIYMVVITIFGVGYGEVQPLESASQKVFTILVVIAGTSSTVYIVGGFVQMIAEGEINRALEKHRKTRGIENLQQHTIVCGYGRMGQILARKLHEAQQPFAIVESDPDRAERAELAGYLVRLGNAADEEILYSVGIDRAKSLATSLSDDATNVFITLTARGLNPNLFILARGEMPSTENKLKLAGADRVVLPATISALQMANLITHPTVFEFVKQDAGRSNLNELLAQLDLQIHEFTVAPDSPSIGKTIFDLEVRGQGIFLAVALRQGSGTVMTHPPSDLVLSAGDTVLVMGHRDDFARFARRQQQGRYRRAKL